MAGYRGSEEGNGSSEEIEMQMLNTEEDWYNNSKNA